MRKKQTKTLDEKTLEEIIRRVVEVARPEKIIMFGSAARGEMGPNSDVDLLVIKSGEFHQGRLTGDIYRNLMGVGQAVDVILVTPEQVEKHRNNPWRIIAPALRDGREVYSVGTKTDGPIGENVNLRYGKGARTVSDVNPADEARRWLDRSRSHLILAKTEIQDVDLEDLCFHAQQAAEMAIKALLIRRGVVFPYTHDIAQLLALLQGSGQQVPDFVQGATHLTRFAAVTRYPGSASPLTHEEYEQAVRIAEEVVLWAESAMKGGSG
jgi:HEPN domain-containing protein/predicted nucleotidyltransferase